MNIIGSPVSEKLENLKTQIIYFVIINVTIMTSILI